MKNKITPLETKSKFLYLDFELINKKTTFLYLDFELINKKTTFLFLLVSTFFCVSVNAQSGYIYVHKKALNEKSSIDFPFTVSGGPTAVAPFSLNDGDGQLRVKDLGSSQNGRLWAIHETTNTLYYRNTNSNVWVQTSIADANRVDGDINGNAVYINTSGTVFSTDGTTTTQLSSAAAYSGTADIGSGWNGLPYVTRGGIIYQYSGAGITWNVVSDQSATYSSSAIDVDPTNPSICYVVVRNTYSLTNSIIRVNAGVVTNIGAPFGMSNEASKIPRDVAVNDKAELFISAVATNWYVYKYTTSWSAAEVTSFDVSNLTGGVGGELWVTMNSGNQSFGQPTVPYYNIFTRATNGTNVYYIDDERVRTTAGNSILIPVLSGTYTITEALSTADWDLQAIRIEDPTNNSTSNQVNGTATIDVAAGEIVNVVFQNGQLNPIAMTASCTANYLEDFGTGAVGTFGSLVPGQTSYHFLDNTVRAEDGYCKVVSTAFPDFNNWRATPFYDHTSGNGTGRMYAVNAGYDLGEFFRRRFTGVVPGFTYNVSAWVANLTPGEAIKPNIKFQIVDHITQAVIATYDTGDINTGTIQWNQYSFTFTATSSDIDLILSNNAIGGNGNDLAIDDISFSLPPATPTIGSVTQPTCSVANGTFVITNYSSANTYSITSPTGTVVSGPTATGLVTTTAGVYTITASANGCTSAAVNATVNAQPVTPTTPTIGSVTQPTCSVANGNFTITNYSSANTYSITSATGTVVSGPTATGLVTTTAGVYTITASANGCTSAAVNVTVNAQPVTPTTPTIGSVTQPTCSVANGNFTITNYSSANTYSITSATGTVVSGPTATGLVTTTAGVYTITASANGCTSAAVNVTVNAQPVTPTTPTIGSVTQPTCSVANGNFTITNYSSANTYSITSATGTVVSGPTATGLVTTTAGVYTITASANGCTSAAVNATVNAQPVTPTTPTIGSVTQPTCSVANGNFTITNYSSANTYSITSATGTVVSGPTATGLVTTTAGVYTITASANGCTSAAVNVTVNAQPVTPTTPTIGSVTQPTCSVANGNFTITNYSSANTYSITSATGTVVSGPTATGLVTTTAGVYTITASANGCTSAAVNVTVNAQPVTPTTPTIGSVTQPTCSVANGSFTITNYSSANTYSITSPTGTVVSGLTATGLVTVTEGVYTITANANGCTSAPVNVTINAQPVTPAVPTVSPVTQPTCSVATGSFTITNYNAANTYTFVPAGPTIDASGVVTASTGSYTLTASANGCTSASVSVTVNAQPATPATPTVGSVIQPTCSVANGTFVITNYSSANTYSITSPTGTVVSGPTATGLVTTTAGVYTITASANGCTSAAVNVTINAQPVTPAVPTVSPVTHPTCSVATGSFTITNYNATNTYTFVPAGPTIDASGVVTASTGSYTLTASANGCTSASVSVTVNAQPATPATPTIGSVTQPTCSVANGTFVITNYSSANTYSITSPTGTVVSGPTATGLVTVTAGSYTVTSTSNGCTSAPVNVTINAQPVTPAVPTVSPVTHPTCSVATGSFTITNYNATNTYTFVPAGPTIDASGVVTASTGSYTLTASANGCTSASVSVTVNAQPATPATPTIGSVTQPTCSVANGTFVITNYSSANTYSITSPTGTVVSGPTATGLVTVTAGSYTVTSTSNGCTSAPVNVTINAQPVTPAVPTVSPVTHPTCSVATGSFTITNYNATNTYTFVPAGPTIDASGVVTASTGSYTLTASANGCTSASVSVTVNAQPATPATPTIGSVTQPTCSVANGNFTITNYSSANTYSITSATGTVVSGPTATGLVTTTAGVYTITASANGCTSAAVNATVNAQPVTPTTPTIGSVTQPTCSVANGNFTITNYSSANTYSITSATGTVVSGPTATGLVTTTAGVYTITASANGCTSAAVNVTVNAQPVTPTTPTIGSVTQPTCSVANGNFTITNYSSANTYSITSATGTVVSGPTATGLVTTTAGVYTITASANGCTSAAVNVTVNAQPVTPTTPTIGSVTQPTCSVANGSFTITNYSSANTYSITSPTGTVVSGLTATGLVTVTEGVYTITANANGCTSAPVNVTINAQPVTPAVPTVSPVTQPTCSVATGSFTITNYNAANTYTFVPAGPTIAAGGVVTATVGSYTLTASANGCTSAPVSATVNAQPVTPVAPVISNITHPVCTVSASPNGSFVIANYSASNTYSFIPTTGTVVSGPTATGLVTATAGSYSVTSTANGCTSTPVVVVINPLECADIVTVKTDNQTSYVAGQPVTYVITVTNNGPTAATNVNVVDNAPAGTTFTSWSSSNGSGTGNINDTIATLAVGQTVTYTVNVDVPATLLGNLENTVTVTTTTPDPVPGCTTCTDIDTPNTTLAENDINNTFMNIPVSGSVLTNDSDPQGHAQTVTASITTTPEGTLVLNANGTYTFTPATGFTGTFVHTYTVCDNGTPQACDTATLTIEVMPNPNDPDATNDVVANDDTATTEEGQPVTINILSNDFDPNGDTLGTPTVVTPPTNGTFDPVTGVYTPNPGFVGVDTFVYQVCDDATPQACDTAVVTITVNPTNPVNTTDANDDAYNGDQYQPINGSVLDNDNDIEGNTQTVTSNTQPQNGTVVMNPDGTFVYTPTGEYSGPDQFTYTVCDSGMPQACDTATVYLTINPANTTNAENDINNTFMNIPVSGSVLTNDSDPQGHAQTVTASTTTTPEGTLVLNANGTYTFTPATGFVGSVVYPYTVCDNGVPQACASATLTVDVLPLKEPGSNSVTANDDTATTAIGTPIKIDVTANDFDIEGNTFAIKAGSFPSATPNGTVALVNGALVYTPNAGFIGKETFTYEICDTGSPVACDMATVTVTVNPANPLNETYANDDAFNGSTPTITGNVLTNDTDPEGNTQTVTSNTQPQNGTVVMNPDGTFTYTPTVGYYGPDQFVYSVCDTGTPKACDTATVYLTVTSNPSISITKDGSYFDTDGNGVSNVGDVIKYVFVVKNTGNVTLTNVTVSDANATITGGPLASLAVGATDTTTFTGVHILTQSDLDKGVVYNLATVTGTPPVGAPVTGTSTDPTPCTTCPVDPTCPTCTISSIPNITLAENDINNTFVNTPVSGSVLTNDSDPQGHTQTVTAQNLTTAEGTLVLNTNGTYTFTPATGFVGSVVYPYTVCDNGTPQACATATLTVDVLPLKAPGTNSVTANDDTATTAVGTPIKIDVTANDFDIEGNTFAIKAGSFPSATPNGTVVLVNGALVYTPNAGFAGKETFPYEICDTGSPVACDMATVTVTVNPANPLNETYANDDAFNGSTPTITGNVLTNDTDPEGNTQTVTSNTQPQNGTVVMNPDGTFTYTPTVGYYGPDQFVYSVCDNGTPKACDTATVYLTVTSNPSISITKDGSYFDTDGNGVSNVGDVIKYVFVVKNTGNVTLTNVTVSDANATITGGPLASLAVGASDAITFTGVHILTQSDLDKGVVYNLATVTGTPPVGAPVTGTSTDPTPCTTCPVDPTCPTCTISSIPNITLAENDINNTFVNTPVSGSVLTNDSDPQGHTQTVTAQNLTTAEGTLVLNTNGTYTFTPATGFVGSVVYPYTVCDNGTPQACATATLTVDVLPLKAPGTNSVTANDDTATTAVGTPIKIDVTANDFDIEGNTFAIKAGSFPSATPNGTVVLVNGALVYTPNAGFAGKETFPYEICDTGSPVACDMATVTVTVNPANPLNETYANDDAFNGSTPTITGNVLTNDTDPEGNTQTVTSNTQPQNGTVVMNPDGTFTYTPTVGYYGPDQFVYSVCDTGTPKACDTATVYLTVTSNPSISITKDGSYFDTDGNGVSNVGDVIKYVFVVKNTGNVTLTNVTVSDANATITGGPLASLAVGATDTTTFTGVHVLTQSDLDKGVVYNLARVAGTPPVGAPVTGTSTDPTPCTTCLVDPTCPDCTITVVKQMPSIALIKTGVFDDNNGDGYAQAGETITYSFTVTNTGNVPLTNVAITDPLVGVIVSGGPINLGLAMSDSTSFTAVYHLTQEDINSGKVTNQATAAGTSPLGVIVYDLSDNSNNIEDKGTVLGIEGCKIEVFNAITPNGDGENDTFYIRGLECYPKNTVEIYNRWGVLVYSADGYNNNSVVFKGISEGRVTVKQAEGLPTGTYYYILKYLDSSGSGQNKAGYLYLNNNN